MSRRAINNCIDGSAQLETVKIKILVYLKRFSTEGLELKTNSIYNLNF